MSQVGEDTMAYLYFADWEQHLHYRNRKAVWIKFHLALLNDYAFSRLPDVAKGQYLALMLLAARDGGRLPRDPEWLAKQIGATEPMQLDTLVSGGLLLETPASKALQPEIALRKEGRKEGMNEGIGLASPEVEPHNPDRMTLIADILGPKPGPREA